MGKPFCLLIYLGKFFENLILTINQSARTLNMKSISRSNYNSPCPSS